MVIQSTTFARHVEDLVIIKKIIEGHVSIEE